MYPIIKANYSWLLLCGLFALGTPVGAQDCTTIIKENKKIAGVQIVRSGTVTFVVRGNYNYGIEFFTDEKGIFARLISTGGIEFNQDDQVVFVDASGVERAYKFVGLDNTITAVNLVSFVNRQKYKFTLNSS